jgi:hypothetical protein
MGRFRNTLAHFDADIARAQHSETIFIGDVISDEQRRVNIKRLPQRPETVTLGSIRHSALENPVTRAHYKLIGPFITQKAGSGLGRDRHISLQPPGMDSKPEGLDFNPGAWNVPSDLVEALE